MVRSGGSRYRTKSPPTVSAKREYLRIRPETFGDFRLNFGEPRVRRRKRMREMPGFPAHFRFVSERRPIAGMPGWRRSANRTCLQPNSLQTGNFTGKITISGLKATIQEQETAVPQGLFSKFPKQIIREKFPTNREFYTNNREFHAPGVADLCGDAWFCCLLTVVSAVPSPGGSARQTTPCNRSVRCRDFPVLGCTNRAPAVQLNH
jgi:hypothetical protein